MFSCLSGLLAPGFRFHPTDEELVTVYLKNRVYNKDLDCLVIQDQDLAKCEPWEVQNLSLIPNSVQWFFFSPQRRKGNNPKRISRATQAGYWKATGVDRPVIMKSNHEIIGLKKSLVFYEGHSQGKRMDWIMHEYRLEGGIWEPTVSNNNVEPNYVLCKIFKKRMKQQSDERRDDSFHEGSSSCTRVESVVHEVPPLSGGNLQCSVSESYMTAPSSLSLFSTGSKSPRAASFLSQTAVSPRDEFHFSSTAEVIKLFQEENDRQHSPSAMLTSPAMSMPSKIPEQKDSDTNLDDFEIPQTHFTTGSMEEIFENPLSMVGRNPSRWAIDDYLPALSDSRHELCLNLGSMVEDIVDSEIVSPVVQSSSYFISTAAAAEHSSAALQLANVKTSTSYKGANQPQLQATICNSTVPQGYSDDEESTANRQF